MEEDRGRKLRDDQSQNVNVHVLNTHLVYVPYRFVLRRAPSFLLDEASCSHAKVRLRVLPWCRGRAVVRNMDRPAPPAGIDLGPPIVVAEETVLISATAVRCVYLCLCLYVLLVWRITNCRRCSSQRRRLNTDFPLRTIDSHFGRLEVPPVYYELAKRPIDSNFQKHRLKC